MGHDSNRDMTLSTFTCRNCNISTEIRQFSSVGILQCASKCVAMKNCKTIAVETECKLFETLDESKDVQNVFCYVDETHLPRKIIDIKSIQGNLVYYVHYTWRHKPGHLNFIAREIGGRYWRFHQRCDDKKCLGQRNGTTEANVHCNNKDNTPNAIVYDVTGAIKTSDRRFGNQYTVCCYIKKRYAETIKVPQRNQLQKRDGECGKDPLLTLADVLNVKSIEEF